MKNLAQSLSRWLAFRSSEQIQRQAILLGEIRAAQIAQRTLLNSLADAEFCVFSQWGEDGIISWLTDLIHTPHTNFVEFGVENFREANCRFLLMSKNWSGLVIDGSERHIQTIKRDAISWKYDLQSKCAFINRDNISELLRDQGVDGPIGILSVDIDGVDYWVLEAIPNQCDIVVVEYNDLFSGSAVSIPYNANFTRMSGHPSGMYWGASLEAFKYLLEGRGYRFVGTNRIGTNAFFVAEAHLPKIEVKLTDFVAWPCQMREARDKNGKLSLKTYRESWKVVADLPLVDVVSGTTLPVSSVVAL